MLSLSNFLYKKNIRKMTKNGSRLPKVGKFEAIDFFLVGVFEENLDSYSC